MIDTTNYDEPTSLPCGWTCPPDYTKIVCDGCKHIFGELKPVKRGTPEARPKRCDFCVEPVHISDDVYNRVIDDLISKSFSSSVVLHLMCCKK